MNVLILGDIHGYTGTSDIPNIDAVMDVVKQVDAEVILQAGDMGGDIFPNLFIGFMVTKILSH
jgi:predicted phosphodiesterase